MLRCRTTVDSLEALELGDEVLFNDRSVPMPVMGYVEYEDDVGAIYVEYRVLLEGPTGVDIWLERTGTGRIRVKESVPWGAYANVRHVERV